MLLLPDLLVRGSTGISSSATKFTLLAFFVTFLLDGPDLTADVTSGDGHGDDRNVACGGGKGNLKIAGANVLDVGSTRTFFDNFLEGLLNLPSAKQS